MQMANATALQGHDARKHIITWQLMPANNYFMWLWLLWQKHNILGALMLCLKVPKLSSKTGHTCSATPYAPLTLGWLAFVLDKILVMAGSNNAMQQLASFIHCILIRLCLLNGLLKHVLERVAGLHLQNHKSALAFQRSGMQ